MTPVSPAIRELARQLLAVEAAHANGDDTPVDAAVRVCQKLQVPLSRLTGPVGFSSLFSRALALAKTEVPLLGGTQVRPDGSLAGFDAIEHGQAAGAFEKGRVALVAHLLGLLATFIGEPLTPRLACDAWPDASIDGTDPKPGDGP